MGGSIYSDAFYSDRISSHKKSGTDIFKHNAAIRSGLKKKEIHKSLDPKIPNSLGVLVREALDSDHYPQSNLVCLVTDTTGSMGRVPRIIMDNLPKLRGALIKKEYLPQAQLMVGAVNDAQWSDFPIQISQAENGNEIDEAISNIFIEGGGGSDFHESYDLMLYYLNYYVKMDCFEKRGKKGYLFIIADEKIRETISAAEVSRFIGEPIQADISMKEILEELKNKFNIFWLFPNGSNYFGERGRQLGIHSQLNELFEQNLIFVDDPDNICETVVSLIGANEGFDINKINSDLADLGTNSRAIVAVSKSIEKFNNSKKVVVFDGDIPTGESSVERL